MVELHRLHGKGAGGHCSGSCTIVGCCWVVLVSTLTSTNTRTADDAAKIEKVFFAETPMCILLITPLHITRLMYKSAAAGLL